MDKTEETAEPSVLHVSVAELLWFEADIRRLAGQSPAGARRTPLRRPVDKTKNYIEFQGLEFPQVRYTPFPIAILGRGLSQGSGLID